MVDTNCCGEMDRRKRRIDLLLSERLDEAHSQRLANGKYVCLICPSRPVVDTVPMLTMHNQGARHQAAALKLKEKEISKQEEIQKRIALHEPSATNNDTFNAPVHCIDSSTHPLLKKTRKSTADVLSNSMNTSFNTSMPKGDHPFISKRKPFFASLYASNVKTTDQKTDSPVQDLQVRTDGNSSARVNLQSNFKAVGGIINEQQLDVQKQKEMELKFREAGWRRDGQGSWFREENVEFDSDEEDPNVSLGTDGK